jgi:hypothetical protein
VDWESLIALQNEKTYNSNYDIFMAYKDWQLQSGEEADLSAA